MDESATKIKILEAAEQAFGELGYEGASIRQIAKLANVNLATVYYYFKSKEDLLAGVLKRRFEPVHKKQLELFTKLKLTYEKRAIPVSEIIEALLLPVLEFKTALAQRAHFVNKFMGRMLMEPQPTVRKVLSNQFSKMRQLLVEMLQESLPYLSLESIMWRMEIMWGGIGFILCQPDWVRERTQGLCDPKDVASTLKHMKQFFVAGFTAPEPPKSR